MQRWAGPQLVPLCAFPQLAQQGNLLWMCALICRQQTAELRLRTKKLAADLTSTMRNIEDRKRERERERISCFFLCVSGLRHIHIPPLMLFASLLCWTKKDICTCTLSCSDF